MRLLLDTHVFLWFLIADRRLPPRFRDAVEDLNNEVFLSAASVWETVVKHSLGKLRLPAPPAEFLPLQRAAHGIASLSVDEGAFPHLASLPAIHSDPFDRLLIAQALQHGPTLASTDDAVQRYPVPLLSV